jgi:hypothetical protein
MVAQRQRLARPAPRSLARPGGGGQGRACRLARPAQPRTGSCSHATVISPPIMSPFLWILQIQDEAARFPPAHSRPRPGLDAPCSAPCHACCRGPADLLVEPSFHRWH